MATQRRFHLGRRTEEVFGTGCQLSHCQSESKKCTQSNCLQSAPLIYKTLNWYSVVENTFLFVFTDAPHFKLQFGRAWIALGNRSQWQCQCCLWIKCTCALSTAHCDHLLQFHTLCFWSWTFALHSQHKHSLVLAIFPNSQAARFHPWPFLTWNRKKTDLEPND